MVVPVAAPPPAIEAPAPAVRPAAPIQRPAPETREDALRAELARHGALIKAAETTAQATREAAEAAARTAWYAAAFALLGAILAAIVGWRTGWLTTRTTQQVKHADFRQGWIDKLREEMARFIRRTHENDGSDKKEAALRESLSTIVLRMDKDDPDYDTLLDEMEQVIVKSRKPGSEDASGDFLIVSQRILKREWEVTKSGLHDTPWGRPWSWVADRARERRRAEEKEIVRRRREKRALTPARKIFRGGKRTLVWTTRQKPLRRAGTPLLKLGRLQVLPTAEIAAVGTESLMEGSGNANLPPSAPAGLREETNPGISRPGSRGNGDTC